MRKQLLYFVFLQLAAISVFATEDNKYAVSKIDPSLLKGASAIKRYEMVRFEIKDAGNAVYYYKRAVTIMNENGDEQADWTESYDNKFTFITSIDATLFNSDGKKIHAIKKADIGDYSGAGESLAEDARVKHHNFNYKIYPYTVEYEVEIKREGLLYMPSWTPISGEDFSVEKSVFEISCPTAYNIRYKSLNYKKDPVLTNGKEKVYHWEINNFLPVKKEYSSPSWEEITPSVFVAPTNFEIEGYRGEMNSWLEFGKFHCQLNKNRDQLPANLKATIHSLTDTVNDVKRKISLLYQYMQQNTRYISIQLGIGGWQPLDASFVAAKGYGDCKALSNFMYSILKEAGIKSCYTLIKAGNGQQFFLPDFPSRQSNHVILSIPLNKDTMWLECTDQTLPAGYLSGFTANRFAIMIDEDGGHLVKTPAYNFNDNLQVRKVNATVDESGKLNADIKTEYTGMQQDGLFGIINSYSKKEQLEYLKKEIDLPTYDITTFDYKTIRSKIPAIDEKLNVVADNYAQVSGKRIFIEPNLLNKSTLKLKDEERLQDIDLVYEFRDLDTVEIAIPAGFVTEAMPQPVAFNNKFAQYKINYKVDGDKVLMTRFFERKAGRYPATDYKELVKMYADMYKADRGKIVLVKKEG